MVFGYFNYMLSLNESICNIVSHFAANSQRFQGLTVAQIVLSPSDILDKVKKTVLNLTEGSISKGYGTEEVIEFCVDFVPNLKPIGVPESRHEGRLGGKDTLGKKTTYSMDRHSFTQANYTVLHNSTLVAPYIEEKRFPMYSFHFTDSRLDVGEEVL
jgi:hypothetical protein